MFYIRKLHSHSTTLKVDIPAIVSKQIGLKPGDDVMFEFQPGAKAVVLTKSPYDRLPRLRSWTKEEVKLLKNICKDGNIEDLAGRFDRTKGAVRTKAISLGLVVKKVFNGNPWSNKDKKLLIELYSSTSSRELAKSFGRSIASIRGMAKRLGLHRGNRKPWSDEDNKLFMELFSTTSNRELAKRFGRSYSTVGAKASRLGLRKAKKNRMPAAAIQSEHRQLRSRIKPA